MEFLTLKLREDGTAEIATFGEFDGDSHMTLSADELGQLRDWLNANVRQP